MPVSKTPTFAAALLLAGMLGGCYSYVPLRQPAPPAAAQLRLRLSTPGDFRLSEITLHDVVEVDGELVAMDDSTVVLSASRLATSAGLEHLGEGATVRVPRGSIGTLEVRRLSRARSALFAGGLLAVALAADQAFGGGGIVGAIFGHGGTSQQ